MQRAFDKDEKVFASRARRLGPLVQSYSQKQDFGLSCLNGCERMAQHLIKKEAKGLLLYIL